VSEFDRGHGPLRVVLQSNNYDLASKAGFIASL